MSERIRSRRAAERASRPRRALITSFALAALTVGMSAAASFGSVDENELRRASVWRDRGVSQPLVVRSGTARILVLLKSQPVIAEASSGQLQTLIRPQALPENRVLAKDHPTRITAGEKRAAREAEVDFERAVLNLKDEARGSRADLAELSRRIRRLGGVVRARELLPASLIVRANARTIKRIGDLNVVQAVEAEPADRPLSGIGTDAVGAPAWWEAGFTGGEGAEDEVSADAALLSEAADPDHPAFAGVTVDNDPSIMSERSWDSYRRDHRFGRSDLHRGRVRN